MKQTALVGLNSLYRSGASQCLLHLGFGNPADVLVFNENGSKLEEDIDPTFQVFYCRDKDAKNILSEYRNVVFVAPRWDGFYDFLPDLLDRNVAIIVHDTNDMDRMGTGMLIAKYKDCQTFCFDQITARSLWKAEKIPNHLKQPFNKDLFDQGFIDKINEEKDPRFQFLVTSRPTNSKRHNFIREIGKDFEIKILGEKGVYSHEDLENELSKSYAVIDASSFPKPHRRTQYSFMEAWHFGCAVLCLEEWFDYNEVAPEFTVLELNEQNLERIWGDDDLRRKLSGKGNWFLRLHDHHLVFDCVVETLTDRFKTNKYWRM